MDSKKLKSMVPLIVAVVMLIMTILWPIIGRSAWVDEGEGIWSVWLSIICGLIGFVALMLYCNQTGHARFGTSFRLNGGLIVVVAGTLASWFWAIMLRTCQLRGALKDAGATSSQIKAFGKMADITVNPAFRIILFILAMLVLIFGLYLVISSLKGKPIDLMKKLGLNKAVGSVGAKKPAAAAASTASKFCPNCGASVSADTTFCPNCGASLK